MTPENITPYDHTRPKHEQVEEMFDSIAPGYDFMNRAMTLGIDKLWRRRAVRMVKEHGARRILDVATGTADLAITLARAIPEATLVGIDLSEEMLRVGRRKVENASLGDRIHLEKADCLALPFADGEFDCVTVAYGVRNFEHLDRGYAEMTRVLKPGGLLCVVELSVPRNPIVKPFYNAYTRGIIPAVGRMVTGDSSAYTYLPQSIAAMPQGDRMLQLMTDAGLEDARLLGLTLGVCTIYCARKG